MMDTFKEEQRWREIMNLLPEGVIALDQMGEIAYINSRAVDILKKDMTGLEPSKEELVSALERIKGLQASENTRDILIEMKKNTLVRTNLID